MRVALALERSLRALAHEALGVQTSRSGYAALNELWKQFLQYLAGPLGANFLDALSRAEYISLCILREWWCRYTSIAESFIYYRINPGDLARANSEHPIHHFFDLEVHGVFYHHALALLFIREFAPEKPFHPSLSTLRDRAVRVANTHTIARKFCLNSIPLYPRSAGSQLPESAPYNPLVSNKHRYAITATLEACPWLSPEQYRGRPYYLWDTVRKCTVRTAELPEVPYICISHTWGRWIMRDITGDPLKAVVKGVPWPIQKNSKFDVQGLPELLQNADLPESYIWFDLLCIPQCGYQQDIMDLEIARQAAIFGSSRLTGAWLNDIEDWVATQHALRWLSALYYLQTSWGSGFRFGEKVPDFTSPPQNRSPISEIDLSVLKQNAEWLAKVLSNEEERLPPWFTSLWTLQEFCLRPDMILYDRHWRPLEIAETDVIYLDEFIAFIAFAQTTAMRSWRFYIFHSDFVNRKHFKSQKERFRVMDKAEDELRPLLYKRPDLDTVWPSGPAELALMIGGTQLVHAYQGPSKILRFGDMRQCSGRRAEAIMSALGATDWYSDYMSHVTISSGQVVSEPDLVMGKYPAVFLNEVIKKIGSDFFSSRFSHIEMSPRDVQELLTPSMAPIGSLLPFSAGVYGLGFQTNQHIELESRVEDHTAVKSWTVQTDGTVKIRKAGIMAVSRKARHSHVRKIFHPSKARRFWARMRLDAPLLFEKGECEQWMTTEEELYASIPASVKLYMVCLGDGLVESYGVVLQQISLEGELVALMVKVGTWYSFNPSRPRGAGQHKFRHKSDMVPSTSVNWTVL